MKLELQTEFPQEIKSVYFNKWTGGQEGTANGTDFHIEFKKPLSKEIKLDKIYFRNQESNFEEVTKNTFIVHFYQKNMDLILDGDTLKEYGNKAPVIIKPKFDLKPNEALLEYTINNETQFFKIIDTKENPTIAYPSVNKPKN
ncbi:hypothetical protein ACM55G_02085 [Flavobacterium sp. LB3P122]|uniref:hypothetical protein n=1 Tax=Flavobacterium algoriphilum TaxID=3398738 RepID=UPI003A8AC41D